MRGQLAAEGGQVDAEPAERLGRDAVVGLDEGGEQVLGVEDGALERLGGALGGEDGLLGLLGEAVELHRGSPGSRWRGCHRGSGWSTRSKNAAAASLASSRQVGRQDDPDLREQVAAVVACGGAACPGP